MTDHHEPQDGTLSDGAIDRIGRALHTPDHGPAFWAGLDAALMTEVAVEPRPDDTNDNTTTTPVLDHGADRDTGPAARRADHRPERSMSSRSFTSNRTLVLGAAAGLLILVIGLLVFGGRADDNTTLDTIDQDGQVDDGSAPETGDDGTPDGDETDGAESADGDGATPSRSLTVTGSSSGTAIAVDPTSSYLYQSVSTDEGAGCEGQFRHALTVTTIGGDGVQREALPEFDATGRVFMAFGPDGQVALATICEGFGNELTIGRIGNDGTIEITAELSVPFLGGEPGSDGNLPGVDGITDLVFVDAQTVAVSTWSTYGADPGDYRDVYLIPTQPSEPTRYDVANAIALEMTPAGLVTLGIDGVVRVDGDEVATVPGAFDLVVSPDGDTIAAYGQDGLVTFGADGSDVQERFADPVLAASLVNGLLGLQDGDGVGRLITAGADPLSVGPSAYALVGAPDGSRVFLSRLGEADAGSIDDPVTDEIRID